MRGVQRSTELARILALPRRGPEGVDDLIVPLSELLKKPGHVCRTWRSGPKDKGCADGFTLLNGLQTQALVEFHDTGGLFLQGPMGCGKTGVIVLAPRLIGAKRGLLIIPGGGREKTIHDIDVMKEHWDVTPFRIESYQKIARLEAENFFYEPPGPYDCICLDEAHFCKNAEAAVTRRMERLRENSGKRVTIVHFVTKAQYQVDVPAAPPTGVVTATPAKDSIRDFGHTMEWAMGARSPLPRVASELDDWADCLDASPAERIGPGALTVFSDGKDDLESVRKGVAKRIFDTPGCISSAQAYVNAKLEITLRSIKLSKAEDEWFKVLRGDPDDHIAFPGWTTPDGVIFTEPTDLWRHACSMALGYYTVWDPPAPPEWRAARYLWHSNVRLILEESRTLDTVAHVANAVDNGQFPYLKEILDNWRKIEPTFVPNSVPRWIGDTALKYAAEWLKGGGIVWTGHTHFGQELSKRTGAPYFGEEGLAEDGQSIVYTRTPGIIASVGANGVMHNLQNYDRNLIASIYPTGYIVEQCIGRTHRQGQMSDVVTVDWMIACLEQLNGFDRASGSHGPFYRDLLMIPARLCSADIRSEKIDMNGWAFHEQER